MEAAPYPYYLQTPTDTVGAPIGVVTSDGIAWAERPPVYEIHLQLYLRFFKNHPKIDDAQNLTYPPEIAVYIWVNPSNPDLVYGIICVNNPLVYVDPTGHFRTGWGDLDRACGNLCDLPDDVWNYVFEQAAEIVVPGTIGFLLGGPTWAVIGGVSLNQVVMHQWLGINEISMGAGVGPYFEFGINYEDGIGVRGGVGVGSGAVFSIDTNSFDISGGNASYAVVGYDTRQGGYLAASYVWPGASIGGKYYFASEEYNLQAGVGFGYGKVNATNVGIGMSYSSSGGFSMSIAILLKKGNDYDCLGVMYTYNFSTDSARLQLLAPEKINNKFEGLATGVVRATYVQGGMCGRSLHVDICSALYNYCREPAIR